MDLTFEGSEFSCCFTAAQRKSIFRCVSEGYHLVEEVEEEVEMQRSVLDLGCGLGHYGHCLKAANVGIRWKGLDGSEGIETATNGYVSFVDLTVPQYFQESYDWVMSLEVGEHIPAHHEDALFGTIARHAREGVVLTWAVPGQGGHHHVNNHPNEYVIDKMRALNFSGRGYITKPVDSLMTRPELIIRYTNPNAVRGGLSNLRLWVYVCSACLACWVWWCAPTFVFREDNAIISLPNNAADQPLLPLRLLSIDFHIGPIADLKQLLRKHIPQASVVDLSLSGHCHLKGTCATPDKLQVLTRDVRHSLYFSKETRRQFFEHYRNDSLTLDTDAMVCSHPSGMCELMMPFNRSIIIWATTRFEQGRERDPHRFAQFVKNIRVIAAQPGNTILANNMYDVHYVHYFTGIMPQYIPSYCAYTGVSYSWQRNSSNNVILVHGYRPRRRAPPIKDLLGPLTKAVAAKGLPYTFAPLRDVYGNHYEYSQLAAHPAILHLPYQASIMSFYEHYRMGIPVIAPSLDLLTRWHLDWLLVSERTWDTAATGIPANKSVLSRHTDANEPFDPNDEFSEAAVRYWLQFADYYVFPHIILFDSTEDLAQKLATTDFLAVSAAIKAHNEKQEKSIVLAWKQVLQRVISHDRRPHIEVGLTYEERMNRIYGAGAWAEY